MSYVRWSAESAIYIYDDVAGGTTCCACKRGLDMDGNPAHPETIAHVQEHIDNGDPVPDYVIPRLLASQGFN